MRVGQDRFALLEGQPFHVVQQIPMIGFVQMRQSEWALMWANGSMIVVPQSLIRWQWLKDTNVLVPPRVKAILGIVRNGSPVRPGRVKRRKLARKSAGAAVAMR
ncbi:hypothetical protein SARC_08376 [Sphaeroforma arctica JP610]|uniref:Uncharacterized protein n=1 Tax=Sphaeroforma arctica JP610 TaxID=667725 RepID=A0A0L0FRB5_9EUKA|nr:hypothetical protein SARC_08376 [Sphaeroforma arctica JP610]KNC79229.1 hypothetical protein SARC_08376 [Sphaeroforma arctica JP610]|eukprot:XP_014153131.1 hypothetical protein SARC_08376 [Sphaeroforma arctica JP610]